MAAHATVHNQVQRPDGGWMLCFQECTLHELGKPPEHGYRFIWERPNHTLSARGQAIVPDVAMFEDLIRDARQAGWLK